MRWSIRFRFSAADTPAEISTYDINHTERNPSLQSEEVCTKRHATNLTRLLNLSLTTGGLSTHPPNDNENSEAKHLGLKYYAD